MVAFVQLMKMYQLSLFGYRLHVLQHLKHVLWITTGLKSYHINTVLLLLLLLFLAQVAQLNIRVVNI